MDEIDVTTPEAGSRPSLGGGAVAGIIGGIAIGLYNMLKAAAHGDNLWIGLKGAAFPFYHQRALTPGFDAGPLMLGFLIHFGVAIIWGVLFAMVAYGLSRAATVWAGLLWGFVVWLGMFYVALPLVGAGVLVRATPVRAAILEHVIFGLAVGIGFLPFQRTRTVGRPRWSPRMTSKA